MSQIDVDWIKKAQEEIQESIDVVLALIATEMTMQEYVAIRILLSKARGLSTQVTIDLIEGRVAGYEDIPF